MGPKSQTNYGGLLLRGNIWHMRFRIKGVTVAESTRTSSRDEAERVLALRKAEVAQQLAPASTRSINLHDAVERYCQTRAHLPSHKNAVVRLGHFRKKIRNIPLERISDQDVQSVVQDFYAAGMKESSVKGIARYFNAMLNFCEGEGYAVRPKLTSTRVVAKSVRWLTDEENDRLLVALDYGEADTAALRQRKDNSDLFVLLSQTAARYSEIANMTWDQVNFIEKTVVFRRGDGVRHFVFSMNENIEALFLDRLSDLKGKSDYVFPTKVGRHNETHWLKAAVKRAGLSTKNGSITLETLRRSRSVKWLMSGVSPIEIQTRLGHARLQTTLRYLSMTPTLVLSEADPAH